MKSTLIHTDLYNNLNRTLEGKEDVEETVMQFSITDDALGCG